MAVGTCRLTKQHGKMVKSHLLPLALTKPDFPDAPLIQAGYGERPIKRWSSWYDQSIVTRSGEDLLSDADDWGVRELRRLKLVWSGWEGKKSLRDVAEFSNIEGTPWGIRQIRLSNDERMRYFLLSLLWRASVSDRFEFSEVSLQKVDEEAIRQYLLGQRRLSPYFYAAEFIQLSTQGIRHNLPPLAQTKVVPGYEDVPLKEVPIYRFYIDGLIILFRRGEAPAQYENVTVAGAEQLVVTTVTSESSFEIANLKTVMSETQQLWPEYKDMI